MVDRADGALEQADGPLAAEFPRAALVAGIAIAVYLPVLRLGFFSDDWQWLARMNATLERPSYLLTVFTRDFNPGLHASFLLDWCLGGGAAWSFHLQSLLVHGANAGLLYLLSRRLDIAPLPAGVASLLWAWSPRLAEPVTWPAARGHSLSLALVLVALLLWSGRGRGLGRLALGLLAWVLALLTKETALVPVLLLPLSLPSRRWKDPRLLGGVGLVGVLFVAASLALKPAAYTQELDLQGLAVKLPFLLLRPLGLGGLAGFAWPSTLLVAGLFAVALWAARRTPAFAGLSWVLLCTLPFLPLAKLSSRYLYLPAAGWVLVLGVLLQLVGSLPARWRRRGVLLVAAPVGLVFALDAVRIQWEIEAQAESDAPYERLAELASEPLARVRAGETVVVADLGPRDAVRELAAELRSGPSMTRLLPVRPHALAGLVELSDLLNVVRPREPGLLAFPVAPPGPEPRRVFAYDGERFVEVRESFLPQVPPDRLFAARWDRAALYFEAALDDRER